MAGVNDIYTQLTIVTDSFGNTQTLEYIFTGSSGSQEYVVADQNGDPAYWTIGFDEIESSGLYSCWILNRGQMQDAQSVLSKDTFDCFTNWTVFTPTTAYESYEGSAWDESRAAPNGAGLAFTLVEAEDFKMVHYLHQVEFAVYGANNWHGLSGGEMLHWTFMKSLTPAPVDTMIVDGARDQMFKAHMGFSQSSNLTAGGSAPLEEWRTLWSGSTNSYVRDTTFEGEGGGGSALGAFKHDLGWYYRWQWTDPTPNGSVDQFTGVWRLWCGGQRDAGVHAGVNHHYKPIMGLLLRAILYGETESFKLAVKIGRNLVSRGFAWRCKLPDYPAGRYAVSGWHPSQVSLAERRNWNFENRRRTEKSSGYYPGDGHDGGRPASSHSWTADITWLAKFSNDPVFTRAAAEIANRYGEPEWEDWHTSGLPAYPWDDRNNGFVFDWGHQTQLRVVSRFLENNLASYLATGDNIHALAAYRCINNSYVEHANNSNGLNLLYSVSGGGPSPWQTYIMLFYVQQWHELGVATGVGTQTDWRSKTEALLAGWLYTPSMVQGGTPGEETNWAVYKVGGEWRMALNANPFNPPGIGNGKQFPNTGYTSGREWFECIHGLYVLAKAYDTHWRPMVRQMLDQCLDDWNTLTINHVNFPLSGDNVVKIGGKALVGYRPHIIEDILTWSSVEGSGGPPGTQPSNYQDAGLFNQPAVSSVLEGSATMVAMLTNINYTPGFQDEIASLEGSATISVTGELLPVTMGRASLVGEALVSAMLTDVTVPVQTYNGAASLSVVATMSASLTQAVAQGILPTAPNHATQQQFPGCKHTHSHDVAISGQT